jgi:hypothetical protein
MTKLLEWLLGVGIFLGTWVAVISRHIKAQLLEEWMSVIIPLPLLLVALFGVSIMIPYHRVEDNGRYERNVFPEIPSVLRLIL